MDSINFNDKLNTLFEDGWLDDIDFDNDQASLIHFLDISRNLAWDIPSVLGNICGHDHQDDERLGPLPSDPPMHRDFQYFPQDKPVWDILDLHFKERHGLDLSHPAINWNFDT